MGLGMVWYTVGAIFTLARFIVLSVYTNIEEVIFIFYSSIMFVLKAQQLLLMWTLHQHYYIPQLYMYIIARLHIIGN